MQGSDAIVTTQGPRYEPGISAATVGSCGLCLGTVTLQPGQRTKAHIHQHESAHYMLSGEEVEL